MNQEQSLFHYGSWQEAQDNAPGGASLAGWVTVEEREYLFRLARSMRPGSKFLEIGIFAGSNLNLFAVAAPLGVQIIGIDDFSNETPCPMPLSDYCREVLSKTGIAFEFTDDLGRIPADGFQHETKVWIIPRSSHEVGPIWKTPIDICRIDGDHTKEGARQDLDDFTPWIVPGGLLLMDNVTDMTPVRDAFFEWLHAERPDRWEVTNAPTDANVSNIYWVRRLRAPCL